MIVYCASYIKTQGARVLIGQSRTAGNTSITGSTSTGISWEPILMKAKMSIPCGILTTKESLTKRQGTCGWSYSWLRHQTTAQAIAIKTDEQGDKKPLNPNQAYR